jgi:hypothetical protein
MGPRETVQDLNPIVWSENLEMILDFAVAVESNEIIYRLWIRTIGKQ